MLLLVVSICIQFYFSFPHDIEQLKELPVLAPLIEAVEQMGVLLKSSPSSSGNSTIEDFNKIRTLYDFLVNAVDGESSVFEIYEFCYRVLTEVLCCFIFYLLLTDFEFL